VTDEREGGLGGSRRTLDRAVLDATVSQLRQLERRSGLERMIGIGRLILEQFFDGSAAAWRERRKNKNNSVRRLAQHPSCPLSHSSLNQALGVYVTVRALPSVQTFKHVGACHIIAVLHLTEAAQLLWLERAEEEQWSVRQLKAAVLASRRLEGERRGRPKTSVGRARVAKLKRSAVTLERDLSALADVQLSPSERDELDGIFELIEGFWALREHYVSSATAERLVPEDTVSVKAPRLRMVGS
jgi:hypothetical protein